MASKNTRRTTRTERAIWVAAYVAALSRLAYRKSRPSMTGRFCELHADVAMDAYRARFNSRG